MTKRPVLVYLLAGEQSGDVLGGRLMAALARADPAITFAGVGGPHMVAEGLSPLFPMHELAVMGLLEILPRIRRLSRLMRDAEADIRAKRPDILVTIDSPGFMLRLLRRLRKISVPRVHYVAPQVWAWREHRVREFPGLWDSLLCLLPFEVAFFAGHGLPAEFVGHPVLESGADQGNGVRFRRTHGLADDAPILVLMPGSRRSEVGRLMPVYGAMLGLLRERIPGLVPVLPVASAVAETVMHLAGSWPIRPIILTDTSAKHDAYAAASAALTKSGTSTLELALAGVPMAVTYRVNPITAIIARRLIRVQYVAMVNLLSGRLVVPELLQHDCTPERLADEIYRLLTEPDKGVAQRKAFRAVVAGLKPASGLPSEVAAQAVLRLLRAAEADQS